MLIFEFSAADICTRYLRIQSFKLLGVLSFVGYSVSQSSVYFPQDGATNAVDSDMNSCAVTKIGAGEYWKLQFRQSVTVAGVSLWVNGG
jgi:hypothetical protein